jgi:hypothetical protein
VTLFEDAELLATLVAELTSEERRLRQLAEMLSQEKAAVMAVLADAARRASMAEAGEMLKRAARRPPTQPS